MNNFQTHASGSGILKDSYPDESPISRALKIRRKNLEDKTTVPEKDELEQNEKE